MKGGGRTLGSASEVSHKTATHCHSPEEPPVPTGMQEKEKSLLLLCYFFFWCWSSFMTDPKR